MILEVGGSGKTAVGAVEHFGFCCKNLKTPEEMSLTDSCISGTRVCSF